MTILGIIYLLKQIVSFMLYSHLFKLLISLAKIFKILSYD